MLLVMANVGCYQPVGGDGQKEPHHSDHDGRNHSSGRPFLVLSLLLCVLGMLTTFEEHFASVSTEQECGHGSARVQRAQTDTSGDCRSDCGSRRHAEACERKAAAVRSYRQCRVEGGCRSVGALCLPLAYRFGDARWDHW